VRGERLQHMLKTDPDPRVRRRAHALLLVGEGHPQASVARLFHTSAYRVHVWQDRFRSAGREGLADRSRGGRPPTLTADDRAFVEEALDQGPQAYGLSSTVWTLRDLHALGFRSRRPRHDLTHRQDLAAVPAAKQVLDRLQKTQLRSPSDPLLSDFIWSTWTSWDECEVHAHPYLAKVWRRTGQVLRVPAAGDDHKFTVFGALDYASGQVVWQTSACKDEAAFAAFLDHLADTLPATDLAVLVLDKAS
jgi:transposase